jgi:hypothetical protein
MFETQATATFGVPRPQFAADYFHTSAARTLALPCCFAVGMCGRARQNDEIAEGVANNVDGRAAHE